MMGNVRPQAIDLRPVSVVCRGYQGDPFDWSVALQADDGSPADVESWSWQAWIDTGDGVVIPWICTPEPDGVGLYLRGQDTLRLPVTKHCAFDVTGRDPEAGEGRTIVSGHIIVAPRVTPPLVGGGALPELARL